MRSLDIPSLKLVVADTSSVGVLEIMTSPWIKQKAVLIITGTDDKGVGLASGILVDPKLDKLLKGDVAVADSTGFLTTLDSRRPVAVAAAPAGNGATSGTGVTTTTPSGPTLTITQIIIGLMLGEDSVIQKMAENKAISGPLFTHSRIFKAWFLA